MPKQMKRISFFLMILLALFLSACSVTSANFRNLETSESVGKSMEPIDVTDEFAVDSPVIYVTGEIKNAPVDTVIKIDWVYVEENPELLIDTVDLELEDVDTTFQFSLTKPTAGWPTGDYEARLYIDDVLKETLEFVVKEPVVDVNADSSHVNAILVADGYSLTARDQESIDYFELNQVNNKYDLNLEVVSLYLGYVNQVERWAEIVQFASIAQAESYVTELGIEGTAGRLVYRYNTVVVVTYSQETIDLF